MENYSVMINTIFDIKMDVSCLFCTIDIIDLNGKDLHQTS